MSRPVLSFLVLILLCPTITFAITDSLPTRYFSLGTRKAGICFGNSLVYTGLRFNAVNKYVGTTNIFDFSLYTADDYQARNTNGISTSLFINEQNRNNGLSFGLIFNVAEIQNGIGIGGIFTVLHKVNGIGIGCMVLICDTINGFTLSSVLKASTSDPEGDSTQVVNGMAVCPWLIDVGRVNGITVAAINQSLEHRGLSIGVFNKTRKLRGVQIGLYNIVKNNPRGLRRLPFINMHLGRKQFSDSTGTGTTPVVAFLQQSGVAMR